MPSKVTTRKGLVEKDVTPSRASASIFRGYFDSPATRRKSEEQAGGTAARGQQAPVRSLSGRPFATIESACLAIGALIEPDDPLYGLKPTTRLDTT